MEPSSRERIDGPMARLARGARAEAPFVLAVALALAAVLIPTARGRLIDGDEGFYLMAARLVAEGKRVYDDFFFPQMPLVPRVYGAWFSLVGPGWGAARVMAGVWAAATGLVLVLEARRRTRSPAWALAALALYLGSGYVLGWFTVAKTYGLAAFLLVSGVVAVQRPGPRAAFVGGLLLALAAGTRLYLLVALPCACLYLLRDATTPRERRRRLAALAAGALAALVLLAPAIVRDFPAFYFGTVRFHSLRQIDEGGLLGLLQRKWAVVTDVVLLQDKERTGNLQFLCLLALGVASALSKATRRNDLASYVWIALLAASFLPDPVYSQYFCLLVPFLILATLSLLGTVKRPAHWTLVGAGLAFLAVGAVDWNRYVRSGLDVPGVLDADRVSRWRIPTVEAVARKVDSLGQRFGASWWPGYFVSSRTPIAVELANDFGLIVAGRIPERERERFHLIDRRELARRIQDREYPLVVEGNWTSRREADLLPPSGYGIAGALDTVRIWTVGPRR